MVWVEVEWVSVGEAVGEVVEVAVEVAAWVAAVALVALAAAA